MKFLITGFSGFVSAHFLELLNRIEPGSEILGIDKNVPDLNFSSYPNLKIQFRSVDLLDRNSLEQILVSFRAEYILHLASISSVAKSWQTPIDSFVNNTNIFLNLVELIRIRNISCRLLSIGSSEEFGQVHEKELPLTEEHPLRPLSPYAVARVSQEMLSKVYADGFLQDIIITRSFNHIGPGQKDIFVISSFAKQLVLLSRKKKDVNKIVGGNLSIIRDFIDVRDVVKAYYLLFKEGRKGEIYNICSGRGVILEDIIYKMSELLGMKIQIEVDPQLIRPSDNKKIIGSYQKIKNELGWTPEISIEKSLSDVIQYWQTKLVGYS
jgi:GDP-4-dehydro-6-deoxy-D-mannose reductase